MKRTAAWLQMLIGMICIAAAIVIFPWSPGWKILVAALLYTIGVALVTNAAED